MRNLTNLLCGFALTVCGTCYATADMKDTGNMKEEKRIVQTAGRDNLGAFAPDFAHYNDDVLFGENWNNKDISLGAFRIIWKS